MKDIRRFPRMAAAALLAIVCIPTARSANPAVDIELWRLDCGTEADWDKEEMSDVYAYRGQRQSLTDSCYLIRHEQQYMIWEAGISAAGAAAYTAAGLGSVAGRPLTDQLAQIGIAANRIAIIGISHFHRDHTGQAVEFPAARLLIGSDDYEVLRKTRPDDITPWLGENANLEKAVGDIDVFGDGTVVMLSTPGHTLGHHSLLVRLPKFGPLILSGDLWHFTEQVRHNEMPRGTMNRAAELASRDRVLKAVKNLKATLIIEHEVADISKLHPFPASMR